MVRPHTQGKDLQCGFIQCQVETRGSKDFAPVTVSMLSARTVPSWTVGQCLGPIPHRADDHCMRGDHYHAQNGCMGAGGGQIQYR